MLVLTFTNVLIFWQLYQLNIGKTHFWHCDAKSITINISYLKITTTFQNKKSETLLNVKSNTGASCYVQVPELPQRLAILHFCAFIFHGRLVKKCILGVIFIWFNVIEFYSLKFMMDKEQNLCLPDTRALTYWLYEHKHTQTVDLMAVVNVTSDPGRLKRRFLSACKTHLLCLSDMPLLWQTAQILIEPLQGHWYHLRLKCAFL